MLRYVGSIDANPASIMSASSDESVAEIVSVVKPDMRDDAVKVPRLNRPHPCKTGIRTKPIDGIGGNRFYELSAVDKGQLTIEDSLRISIPVYEVR
jgi:hypothetical protein